MLLSGCNPSGCGPLIEVNQYSPTPTSGLGIDQAFHPYVSVFEEHYGNQVTFVDMVFTQQIGGKVIGQCTIPDQDKQFRRLIRIDRQVWDLIPDYVREALVFHELGHCVLGRQHDDAVDDNGCADSLMHPYINVAVTCYKKERDKYLNELFSQQP